MKAGGKGQRFHGRHGILRGKGRGSGRFGMRMFLYSSCMEELLLRNSSQLKGRGF